MLWELSVTCGKANPLPAREIVLGDPAWFPVMKITAYSAPTREGVNPAEIVQLAPAAILLPHVLATEKSAALAPIALMVETNSAAVPVFDTVTLLLALTIPTPRPPNCRPRELSINCGALTPAGSGEHRRISAAAPVAAPLNAFITIRRTETCIDVNSLLISSVVPHVFCRPGLSVTY